MATAYYYVHGPVSAFIRIPKVGAGPFVNPARLGKGGVGATFLGHCDKSPKQTEEQKWKPVFSSQSGEVIAADKLFMGHEIKIILPLQRFDFDVIQLLRAAPRYGRLTPPGTLSYLDVGALLQRNGLGVELWLKNEFYGTINAAAYPNLPIGTYFPCCNVVGTYPDNMGRDATLCQLMIEANWVQAWPAGNSVCYSQSPTVFAGLPQIG